MLTVKHMGRGQNQSPTAGVAGAQTRRVVIGTDRQRRQPVRHVSRQHGPHRASRPPAPAPAPQHRSLLSTPSHARAAAAEEVLTLDDGRRVRIVANGRSQFAWRLAPRPASPGQLTAHVHRYLLEGTFSETPPACLAAKIDDREDYAGYVTHPAYPYSALALRDSGDGGYVFANVKSLGFGSRQRTVNVALPDHAGAGTAKMTAHARKRYAQLAEDRHFQPAEAIADVEAALAEQPWHTEAPDWFAADSPRPRSATGIRYVVRDDEAFALAQLDDDDGPRWLLVDYQRASGA